ncbi:MULTISPECIES: NAD(P)/FAD-dependent oxidoreductase [unclassified Actinomadura]|uniref:NAD(P)/FAD-dependent oxidoreductase n=1 Tax=unclassified Actinomadura TaxID=2626254 RepID=UPI0011EF6AA4|nr:NAD(P)/FAD-dependent oxidoreductase [Actinomadura sp. K4S16]
MEDASKIYDVAVLGAGIAGSTLATVLARNGARTLIVDGGSHPKFAVGESTVAHTLVFFRAIAARYDVPEINHIASVEAVTKHIAPTSGIKRGFGFMFHQEGRPQDPSEVSMFSASPGLHNWVHMYRQDVDAYLFRTAIKYGATGRQNFPVSHIDFDDSGVTITGPRDEQYRARYVVDATGAPSPLARQLGMREDPCRFKHHSRSMWTHVLNVPRTDDLFPRKGADAPPKPWYSCTMHHLFERGWFWLIPFNNYEPSLNPQCSVGLTMDPRRYPLDPSVSPEEDFYRVASRYPDIARQFDGVRPVREWTRVPRLQYSSRQTVGDRWCLLAHAAGFIDPLFSRGISTTAECILALGWRLLDAIKDDDFSADRFEYMERLQQGLFNRNDDLVNSAFISFADHDLWTSLYQLWVWGQTMGAFRLAEGLDKYQSTGDPRALTDLEECPYLGHYWPDHEGYGKLFDVLVDRCEQFEAGNLPVRDAADEMFELISAADFMPKGFGVAERRQRYLDRTLAAGVRAFRWARSDADPEVARMMKQMWVQANKKRMRRQRLF